MKKKTNAQLKKELTKLSHDYIRRRDSSKTSQREEVAGHCFDCGTFAVGQQFQCGHWIPDSVGGVTLRYHPHNMHGQSGGCNMSFSQERVKIDYTFAMIKKYGKRRVEKLRTLKQKIRKADAQFFTDMIELYKEGNEKKIINYLEK